MHFRAYLLEINTTNSCILSFSSFLPQQKTPAKPVSLQGHVRWEEREEPEPAPARSLPLASQQKNPSLDVKNSIYEDVKRKNLSPKKDWRFINEIQALMDEAWGMPRLQTKHPGHLVTACITWPLKDQHP